MILKSIAICSYLTLLYWMSTHFSELHMIFFPTLGAFGFICITRTVDLRWIMKICVGAVASSVIGASIYTLHSGVLSLLAVTLITIWMIHHFKLNAPPILAISLIPFFSKSGSIMIMPLSVSLALLGLLAVTSVLYLVEHKSIALNPWKNRAGSKSQNF